MANTTTTTTTTTSTADHSGSKVVVNLVWSYATLLSGGVYDCHDINTNDHENDDTCEGGIAVLMAFLRHHSSSHQSNNHNHNNNTINHNMVIPLIDYQSPFVQMHPLDWNINRLVLHDYYQLQHYHIYRSFLSQHVDDGGNRDLSLLHTHDIHPLIGNFVAYTSSSWSEFLDHIVFQKQTNNDPENDESTTNNHGSLALFVIDDGDDAGNDDTASASRGTIQRVGQVQTARNFLNYLHALNQENGCHHYHHDDDDDDENTETTSNAVNESSMHEIYRNSKRNLNLTASVVNQDTEATGAINGHRQRDCWIPVIIYEEYNLTSWTTFLNEVTHHEHPPAVIIDVRDNDPMYNIPQIVPGTSTWVASYTNYYKDYYQNQIEIQGQTVVNVTLRYESMRRPLPDYIQQDTMLQQDLQFLRALADEAVQNDPIQGYSEPMPEIVNSFTSVRLCMGGECPLGNLFTDAMRWQAKADIAFIQSGGIRGPGWPAGPVRVSDIWEALPFGNTLCTGTMSGLSLVRVLNFATRMATYQGTWTRLGDRLLQVSGMRYTYNTLIPENRTSRLVGVDIWNEQAQVYEPVERLKLYKFVSSSWMCGGFDPFPSLLGEELRVKGEKPGVILDTMAQSAVGHYLRYLQEELGQAYNTSLHGRLVNNTDAWETLDSWIQTKETCPHNTYWVEDYLTCFRCPSTTGVAFTDNTIASFSGVQGTESSSMEETVGRAELVNGETFPVTVSVELKPSWITIQSPPGIETTPTTLKPGESLTIEFTGSALNLEAGAAQGAISFGVVDGGFYPGCEGRDATFDVVMNVEPQPMTLSPSSTVVALGFGIMAVIVVCAAFCALWVQRHRNVQIVRAMQPFFLVMLCAGVAVIALSIIPMSLQDDISTQTGRDVNCMVTPWLLSVGFSLVMSALVAKLWRINKIFNGKRHQRVRVTVREALLPAGVLLVPNLILLGIWTGVDPLRWTQQPVKDDEYQLYSICKVEDTAGKIMQWTVLVVDICSLLLAMYQAIKARKISYEYSESNGLGLALYGWVQIVLVGGPVLLLLEGDNPSAQYFLQVALVLASCTSMLLFIFVPIILKVRQEKQMPNGAAGGVGRPRVFVSGVNLAVSATHTSSLEGNSSSRFLSNHDRMAAAPETYPEGGNINREGSYRDFHGSSSNSGFMGSFGSSRGLTVNNGLSPVEEVSERHAEESEEIVFVAAEENNREDQEVASTSLNDGTSQEQERPNRKERQPLFSSDS